ncbi:MAG: hypothetical protein QNK29_14415 [Desulfobacterales bacterium]|nr:hypothetical protein [Desulfobacterales bacterium]
MKGKNPITVLSKQAGRKMETVVGNLQRFWNWQWRIHAAEKRLIRFRSEDETLNLPVASNLTTCKNLLQLQRDFIQKQ